jgi:hypothetical protein
MAVVAQTDPGFAFKGLPAIQQSAATTASPPPADPLGPLARLEGTWKGHGFNTIWRPHHPANPQDRFLELNLTDETLVFTRINGPIPNRGLAMPDINMHGLTYMQQISQSSDGAGLHIEPGIWAIVPATSDPNEQITVVRMASIPHGTVMLAQGETPQVIPTGPPHLFDNDIIPFTIGNPSAKVDFPERDLSTPTPFRFVSPGVTQDIVDNPNKVLQNAIQGQTINGRTFIRITTLHTPVKGGGTANTAFLASSGNPPGGNANAAEVDATFWIETVAGSGGNPDFLQLQYTQLVLLNFNGLSWPHVSVATLVKQ